MSRLVVNRIEPKEDITGSYRGWVGMGELGAGLSQGQVF